MSKLVSGFFVLFLVFTIHHARAMEQEQQMDPTAKQVLREEKRAQKEQWKAQQKQQWAQAKAQQSKMRTKGRKGSSIK